MQELNEEKNGPAIPQHSVDVGAEKVTRNIINAGLYGNILLAAVKTTAGILGHSNALVADGINSTSDVVYLIAVRIFIRMAEKPADSDHPYGHRQMESIAALLVGAFVITTAVTIFWNSLNRGFDLIVAPNGMEIKLYTLWIALSTIVVKAFLASCTRTAAYRQKNVALLALAQDHRNDIFASAGAAAGILMGKAGFAWGDPLAGAVVALIILQTGISILRESSSELMDTVPGEMLDRQIRSVIAGVPEVIDIEDICAHRFGPYLMVNIIMGIDGALTVWEGDAIATRVEQQLFHNISMLQRVYIHYHPAKNSRRGEVKG